jgi:hypothetical protein
MTRSPNSQNFDWRTVVELLKVWRGAAHSRFAGALVWIGFLLISGPPIWFVLTTLFLSGPDSKIAPNSIISIGIGLLVLLIGVGVFVFFEDRKFRQAELRQGISMQTVKGASFDWTVEQLGRSAGVTCKFVNFSDTDKSALLREHRIQSDSLEEAILALRALVEATDFPEYKVSRNGPSITIEAEV